VKTLKLSDGRYLAYDEYGDPDGTPVIFNHGLAHSRVIRHPHDAVTASLGVRVIAADQPGAGGSSPQPGRKIVDWGKDVEELVDALGLGTVNVAGHSDGAPFALAIPHWLPDRVGRIALASPLASLDEACMRTLMLGGESTVEMTMAPCDWGFEPEDISQHVELFYGDADDILDPTMSRHLGRRLPDCTTHVWKGAGHYGFIDPKRWTEFLTAVA
jgi:pimeloyl-ACP methyl ester carboxylesterase